MKKAVVLILFVVVICACTAFQPKVEEVPAEPEKAAVVAIYTACPQAETPQTAPSEAVKKIDKPVLPSAPEPMPPETPQPSPEPEEPPVPSELPIPVEMPAPMPAPSEPAYSGYGGYVPGFGWIESQGAGTGTIADSIYENGNKVGIMN